MWLLFGLSLLSAIFEIAGVTTILPFMALASNPNQIHSLTGGHPEQVRTAMIGLALGVMGALSCVHLLTLAILKINYRLSAEQQENLSRRLLASYLTRPYQDMRGRSSIQLRESLLRVRSLGNSVFRPAVNLAVQGCSALLLVSVLGWVDWQATLVVTVALGLLFGQVYLRSQQRLIQLGRDDLNSSISLGSSVNDSLANLAHLKLANCEGAVLDNYLKEIVKFGDISGRQAMVSETPRLTIHTLSQVGLLLLVIYLELTTSGQPSEVIPRASLFAFATYRLVPCVQGLLGSLMSLKVCWPTVTSLQSDLELCRTGQLDSPPNRLSMNQRLCLQNLSAGYSTTPILKEINLEIARGAKIGLVGATGSGKSTLLLVLAGLLTPSSGSLELDGAGLNGDRLRAFQQSIGFAPQDLALADATLSANIALGQAAELHDLDQIQRAARLAQVEEFAPSLAQGYETRLGERGIRLSGGQRQRVGIARALYREPTLLILDEACSGLDASTESKILSQLVSDPEITMVVATHRLETLRDFDHIVVLEAGRVVSQGGYQQLQQNCSVFATLLSPNR